MPRFTIHHLSASTHPFRSRFEAVNRVVLGTLVGAKDSDFGWAVVSRHDASEQDGDSELRWPWRGSPTGSFSKGWL